MMYGQKSSSRKAGSANPTSGKGGGTVRVSPGKGGVRHNSVTHCNAKGKANRTAYSGRGTY